MTKINLSKAQLLPKKLRLVFLVNAQKPAGLSAENINKINPEDKQLVRQPFLRADLIVVGRTKQDPKGLAKTLYLISHDAGCVWLDQPEKELARRLQQNGFKELSSTLYQKSAGVTPKEYGKAYIDRWGDLNWVANAHLAATQILAHRPKGFKSKSSTILDVGCLNGYIMEALNREGVKNVFGTDISYFLAVDRNINPYLLPAITICDFIDNEYQNGSFDMVICMEVLEHISPDSTNKFIRELGRIMKKDGRLLISTSEDWFVDATHINCRNRADWYWQFSRANLVPVGSQTIFPGFNSFVLRKANNPLESLLVQLKSGLRFLQTGRLKHQEEQK
ncbi:MAG TPA: class I SAM-dependent methyltransferase [Candidatus Saccharimonadales bacterium]|nr:class I SAM-dependent methyltransferase [Candidatus Saccharimonadales bacterium]